MRALIGGADVRRDDIGIAISDAECEQRIVAAFLGDVPPISATQFDALVAARAAAGEPLSDEAARAVISAHGGHDGHD